MRFPCHLVVIVTYSIHGIYITLLYMYITLYNYSYVESLFQCAQALAESLWLSQKAVDSWRGFLMFSWHWLFCSPQRSSELTCWYRDCFDRGKCWARVRGRGNEFPKWKSKWKGTLWVPCWIRSIESKTRLHQGFGQSGPLFRGPLCSFCCYQRVQQRCCVHFRRFLVLLDVLKTSWHFITIEQRYQCFCMLFNVSWHMISDKYTGSDSTVGPPQSVCSRAHSIARQLSVCHDD